jgi:hypothetical protein
VRRALPDVARHRVKAPGQFARKIMQLLSVQVAADDNAAIAGQPLNGRAADTRRSSGYDDDLSHARSLLL